MALQTFYCNLESTSASRCSITIPKIGDATLGIRLHACSTPMQLDLTIEVSTPLQPRRRRYSIPDAAHGMATYFRSVQFKRVSHHRLRLLAIVGRYELE
ncbi:hypothetical protein D918_09000 [Trichuris suis]|nr:hypothetical protein D918_09000 [Trichuris suis]